MAEPNESAEPEDGPVCFVIMPMSVTERELPLFGGDGDHWFHTYQHLFVPAIRKAGLEPKSPWQVGSEVIHAQIIEHLDAADLVLVDLSALNPNVFFEAGVRTALNKPTALVRDERVVTMPFDLGAVGCHTYQSSLLHWDIESQIGRLATHIRSAVAAAKGQNQLWKHFGTSATSPGTVSSTADERVLDLLETLVAQTKSGGMGTAWDRMPVKIERAWYGIGSQFPEVTEVVRGLMRDGRLDIVASHAVLGIADPMPQQEKRLDIEWSVGGVPQQKMFFVEGTRAILPPGPHPDWQG